MGCWNNECTIKIHIQKIYNSPCFFQVWCDLKSHAIHRQIFWPPVCTKEDASQERPLHRPVCSTILREQVSRKPFAPQLFCNFNQKVRHHFFAIELFVALKETTLGNQFSQRLALFLEQTFHVAHCRFHLLTNLPFLCRRGEISVGRDFCYR